MNMKKNIYLFSFLMGIIFSLPGLAQENAVKNRITLNVYTTPDEIIFISPKEGNWYYFLEGAYGINRYFDVGGSLGTSFLKNSDILITSAEARYYFTPLLFRKANKTDLYIKGLLGYHWTFSEGHPSKGCYCGGFLGFRYSPLRRMGLLLEAGYVKLYSPGVGINLGLSFRFGK